MNNKRKIGESYRPKAIDSFGYQPAEQVSMPSKPPTSGSNIIKTEKLSQNEGVREVIKELCKRFGRIKEKNEERRKNISENVETVCIGEKLKAMGERFGIRDCVCELIDYAEEIGFSERQLFEWQGKINGRKIDKE